MYSEARKRMEEAQAAKMAKVDGPEHISVIAAQLFEVLKMRAEKSKV